MPLLKRKPFESEPVTSKVLKDNQKVFYCALSKEIFEDYEEYFERTMLFNSTIWTCAISGRPNLTYAEALESEKKHRKVIEAFPQVLKGPVVFVANLTKRSAISDLVDDVFNFVNSRYFKGEVVQAATEDTSTFIDCEVVGFVIATVNGNSPNGKLSAEDIRYRVKQLDNKEKSASVWTVATDNIRRKKKDAQSILTKDKLKLFLKQCIEYNDIRMLTIKPDVYKKYVEDANITSLSSFFVGKAPTFELSKALADKKEKEKKEKIKEKKKEQAKEKEKQKTPKAKDSAKKQKEKAENGSGKSPAANGKGNRKSKGEKIGKQTSISQFMTKEEKKSKTSAADLEKAKKLAEEMNRKRKEKEAEDAERQKRLAEEREKQRIEMQQLVQTTVKNLNAVKDDLELQDQKTLPPTKPVKTLIPDNYFAEATMIQEIIYSYTTILEDKDKFRNGINLSLMERALLCHEVAGPLSDILQVLLGSIFSFQIEEHNEINMDYTKGVIQFKDATPFARQALIREATNAARWSLKYLNAHLFELPIDATTLTEILRLHFLMSGARLNEACAKWQISERGGYQNNDDPGLILRENHPHILKALSSKTVYELPIEDIMIVLKCLVDQLLTYSSMRDAIEERLEKSSKAKTSIKNLILAERKREAQVVAEKKEALEEVKKGVEALQGTDEEKAVLKERLDKEVDTKIKSIEHYAEKEKNKFIDELESLRREVFAYQLYLGSDRAYRSYWLFESLPGLFIEHNPFGGKCQDKPVENIPGLAHCPADKRYMFIKHMLHEKQNYNSNANDKENKISNMLDTKQKTNGSVSDANKPTTEAPEIKTELIIPTQNELMMCTGDGNTCMVHRKDHPNRVTWSFVHTEEELNALIDSLNSRGVREKYLKEQLDTQKELILYHIKNCPVEKLQVDVKDNKDRIEKVLEEKDRTYANANLNYPRSVEISTIMQSEIRNSILELEFKLTSGQLGSLKVKDRMLWRQNLESNSYDMQCEYLQWGPDGQFSEGKSVQTNGFAEQTQNGKMTNGKSEEEEDSEDDDEEDSVDLNYQDPGANLEKIKTENGNEGDVDKFKKTIHNYACALLQVGQAVDAKYFKPPFGNLKAGKRGKEDALKKAKRNFDMWCVSLMNSINTSQLFLHYNVLYDAIKWTRSVQNAKCVCRSNRDPDKLILCDGCNLGRHIYCLKPKLTKVPEGDWYCSKCKPTTAAEPKKKRRQFVIQDDSDDEDAEEAEAEEEEVEESDEDYNTTMQEESDDEAPTCVRCNKPNRNLFKCAKCSRHYDTKCLKLKNKPSAKWVCEVCTKSKKRAPPVETISAFKFQTKKQYRPATEDEDSELDTEIETRKSARTSLRRKRDSSPPAPATFSRLSSSRRSRVSTELLLDHVMLGKLIEEISKHQDSWPFIRPVIKSEVPDYYKVIKNPMDLAKVKSNLNVGKYSSNYDVISDLQLIFANCDLYNNANTDTYKAGASLEKFILQRCRELNLPYKPSDMVNSLNDDSDAPASKRKK